MIGKVTKAIKSRHSTVFTARSHASISRGVVSDNDQALRAGSSPGSLLNQQPCSLSRLLSSLFLCDTGDGEARAFDIFSDVDRFSDRCTPYYHRSRSTMTPRVQ